MAKNDGLTTATVLGFAKFIVGRPPTAIAPAASAVGSRGYGAGNISNGGLG